MASPFEKRSIGDHDFGLIIKLIKFIPIGIDLHLAFQNDQRDLNLF
jgi:hypothetical protein